MSRIQDAISPVRLGAQFRRLLVSSWTTNLADGIGLAAGPLLVASKTDDPLLVALAALLQRLPWMMFALYAGVVADRYDRRVVVAMSDLTRAAIMVVLVVMVATDSVNVGVVLAVMFLLGAAETFADTTASTLMPMLVESKDLGLANSRIMAGHIVVNQLAGPPIGAFLFAIGVAWPFVAEAVFFAFGAIVLTKISIPKPSAPPTRRRARHEIAEGLRWLWAHPPIRTLTITVVTFNVTFGAAWSVLVLYSSERLGLGDVGFGVLTAMSAIGGVLGSWGYPWVERRLGMGGIMRAGLIIETLTHLGLALHAVADRRDDRAVRVRRACRSVGHDGHQHPTSRRADGAAGPCRCGIHAWSSGRHGDRRGHRWHRRSHRRSDGAVLVRVRRLGHARGGDLAVVVAPGASRLG